MPGRSTHGREPEPLDEILDCLAYVRADYAGDEQSAEAAFDVLHLRLAGRADAMVPPLKLACLIVAEAARKGGDVDAVLASVRDQVLAERDHRGG
jgi:hypothetical protein